MLHALPFLYPFWRVLTFWAYPETTAALTAAPPAGNCLPWRPPAPDLMTARGLIPLSAAGASWYCSCFLLVVCRTSHAFKVEVREIMAFVLHFQTDSEGRSGMSSGLLNASDDGDFKRAKLSYNRGLYSRTGSTSLTGSINSSSGLSSGRGTL